jgi:hypothetical protein
VGLGVAAWLLLTGRLLLLAFAAAGMSGAALSVLLKPPPITGYGAYNRAVLSTFARIGTGIVANVVGLGLLASGVLSFSLNFNGSSMSTASIIAEFGTGAHPRLAGLFLLAIGIVFGFAERTLAAFEDAVLGRVGAKDTRKIAEPLSKSSPVLLGRRGPGAKQDQECDRSWN